MMRLRSTLACLLMAISILALSGSIAAKDWSFEFSNTNGTVDNLLSDSSALFDAYSTAGLKLDYYPFSTLEINLTGEHTYYREVIGLTSNYGSIGATFIPTRPSSRYSIYLSGHLTGRVYHSDFGLFNNNSGDIKAVLGYRSTSRTSHRLGISYNSTAYIYSDIPYKRDQEIFAGNHFSLPGNNSLDVEAGYGRTNYEYLDLESVPVAFMPPDSADNARARLKLFFYSIRLSRPVGFRTGLSADYSNRIFQNDDHNIVYGFSTGYLSPWATIWEGENVTLKLKSYFIPRLILTAGIGYWDKTFLRTSELNDVMIMNLSDNEHRRDFLTRWYVNIQLPLASRSGWFLEPTLKLERTSNRSTQPDVYTYRDTSISFGLTIRL